VLVQAAPTSSAAVSAMISSRGGWGGKPTARGTT